MSHHQNFYFKGLNALRFFAAYLVVLHHGETIRAKFGWPHWADLSLFQNGPLAVSFFFVLSGFLITFLLVSEIDRSQTVSLKNFYMRRVLRIFPLYYLLVFIGLVAIPLLLSVINYPNTQPYDGTTGGLFLFFFLGFALNAFYGSHFLEPLWSIGVEEYFYLIWAPLFKYLKNNVLLIIKSVFMLKIFGLLALSCWPPVSASAQAYADIFKSLKFELMAIGGWGAYVFYHKKITPWMTLVFSNGAQLAFYTLLFIRLVLHNTLLTQHIHPYDWIFQYAATQTLFDGSLFLWLILNTAVNPKAFLIFKHKIWHTLGDISYGIYMYQMLVIFAVVLLTKRWLGHWPVLTGAVVFYGLITVGLLAVAFLSKKYFEDRFLRLKHKFL